MSNVFTNGIQKICIFPFVPVISTIVNTMDDIHTIDFDFDVCESMFEPFKGTLTFSVQRKIRITNFEFSTHDMGCRRTGGRSIKYGLKLTLNGKILFAYHNTKVEVNVCKLILTPGRVYKLETWVGGHNKTNQIETSCEYHYAHIQRSDKGKATQAPFIFIFPDDEEEETEESSNKTCLYIIEYKTVD